MPEREPVSDGADEAGGQEDDRRDQFQRAADGDADETEGKQEQPDDGVEHERQQGERPAEDEEQAPEKELQHRVHLIYSYEIPVAAVPGSISRMGEMF